MSKFDLYKYLYESSKLLEQEPQEIPLDDPEEQPQQNPQQEPQQQGMEGSPADRQQEVDAGVFEQFAGATIGVIDFKPAGGTGGEISIPLKGHALPLKISFAGGRVSAVLPTGDVVPLT